MRKHLSDALQRGSAAMAEVAAIEGPGLWPTYAAEIQRYAMHIEAESRGRLDEPRVYVAAHFVLSLSRIAVGRDALSLLAHWLSPRLGMVDPVTLFDQTRAWLDSNAKMRAAALDDIEELTALVVAQAIDHCTADLDDLASDHSDQRQTIADLREQRQAPDQLQAFDWLQPQTAAGRGLAAAVRSYAQAYPYRSDPLDTVAKIKAARPLRPLQGGRRR